MSWNVRGLGDSDKCTVVRDAIFSASPSIACLQESKLSEISSFKAKTFLPRNLVDSFIFNSASGSRGGIVTTWDPSSLSLASWISHRYSLTSVFNSTTSDHQISVTNVYGPADHRDSWAFLDDLLELIPLISGPWIITGDFNLVRSAEDKSNGIISPNLTSAFNAAIHDLGVDKLPLSSCRFTWSNGQPNPILSRIDRVFVNNDLSFAFPSTSLTHLPRPTSDHTPIISYLSTTIPKSTIFRFKNCWLQNQNFLPFVLGSWWCGDHVTDAAGRLAGCLKATRSAAKVWARRIRAPPFLIQNCKFLILLFDCFEEMRPLSNDERQVRELYRGRLAAALKERAAFWKQRGKHKAVREGDANTAFHHAQASGRLRRNCIRHIEINGSLVANHNAKVEALTAYYRNLLGSPGSSSWNFDASQLYSEDTYPSEVLVAPFSEAETKQALWSMDRNSAPGPDGFGPSFYKSAWSTVKVQVMQLLE